MPRLTSPHEFFREISERPRLKFSLAWLTFLGLAFPAATLVSVGLPEQYVLPAVLVLVLPFQYAIFCLLQNRPEAKAIEEARASENEYSLFLKRAIDLVLGILLLVICAPLLVFIALLACLSSPGPVIYRQERCDLNGRKFWLYKFRSMYQDADRMPPHVAHSNEMAGPVFKSSRDPRVTPVGRVLRKTSLDELPQLFNILKGDMSFVGPRPPLPQEVVQYEKWQHRRLRMKPGLTGLWALEGSNELNFARWMKLDMEYIDNWSLALDFKILLRTIPRVLSGHGTN